MEFDGSDLSRSVLRGYEQEAAVEQKKIHNKGVHATVASRLVEAAADQGVTGAGTVVSVEGDLELPQGLDESVTALSLRATAPVSYDGSIYRLDSDTSIGLELSFAGSYGNISRRLGELGYPPPNGEHCGLVGPQGGTVSSESHDWVVGLIDEAFAPKIA